ncbi:type II toxin-antitoxin system Phd/YefM family antitoxin [Flexivirga oryzae]|uniref:Antitoxin n=1 Tax=Flexivirga oryzae TaxID=1794944 RepID=A0A839N6V3_9MICO|nr:type II toxin-antitoxin system Phd/YefM family antitoxin [Flexivirga oryzae]MBB2892489.1 prevent-host-death family protein [Flexivirga oryzae]
MTTVSASEARQTLPKQLDRVEAGDEVAITRHGRVVAVLVHPDVLRRRRAGAAWDEADRIGELLAEARAEPIRPPVISSKRAEDLLASVRRDRAGR